MNVMPDLVGTTIGGYQLEGRIGEGGMATVYRATHAESGHEVAVKILPRIFAEDKEHLKRFHREGGTIAMLEHPHIVPVLEYGVEGGLSYIVMQHLTGGSLQDWLDDADAVPPLEETARLLKMMADALDFAHSKGVIHRDMKPSNVMFDEQGKLYIVDFGVAKVTSATSTLTGTGTAIGTPAYMAPEQWSAKPATARTDQYAVGAMAYTLTTGKLPFEAETPVGLMYLHLNEYPEPPHRIRSKLPMDLSSVLNVAMAKNPKDRFPSVMEFAETYERVVRDGALNSKLPSRIMVAPSASKVGVTNEAATMKLPPEAISDEVPVADLQKTMLERKNRQFSIRTMVSVAALIIILMGAFIMLGNGDNATEGDGDGNRALAAAEGTSTSTPTAIFGPTYTPEASNTPQATETIAPSPTAGVTEVAEIIDVPVVHELVEMASALGVYEIPDHPTSRIFAAAYESGFAPFVAGYTLIEDDDDEAMWLYLYYFDESEPSDGWALADQLELEAEDIELLDVIDPENPPEMPELPYYVQAERPYGVIYVPTATVTAGSGDTGGSGSSNPPPPTNIPGQPTYTPVPQPDLKVIGSQCQRDNSDGTSAEFNAVFVVKNFGGSMPEPQAWTIVSTNGGFWQGVIQLESNGQRVLRAGPGAGTYRLNIGGNPMGTVTCESAVNVPPN